MIMPISSITITDIKVKKIGTEVPIKCVDLKQNLWRRQRMPYQS